jgi:uncharacterized membrane protein YcaP (DUF421 family)
VTLVAVDALLNRAAARSAVVARIFDGTDTQVIRDGHLLDQTLRRLGLRRTELDHAVRLQNGEDIGQVESGVLTANGQLLLTIRSDQQSATRSDVDRLAAQLARIEEALAARS